MGLKTVEPLNHRLRRLDSILDDAHAAVQAIDHDPLAHEGPTVADDEEMLYCPSCHLISNIVWMRANLAKMRTMPTVAEAESVEGDNG